MHAESIESWSHEHVFLGANHVRNERRIWIVIGLTAAMMSGEIAAGALFGSMALLADGFHMATHAGALAIAALAYLYARRHVRDARFTFGTGKLGELAGYSSAIILAIISLLIGFESILRLTAPVPIRFDEAITVAALGLIVNLASAWLLHEGDYHGDRNHRYDGGAGSYAHSHARDPGHKTPPPAPRSQPARRLRPCPRGRADLGACNRRAAHRAVLRLDLDGPAYGHRGQPGHRTVVVGLVKGIRRGSAR